MKDKKELPITPAEAIILVSLIKISSILVVFSNHRKEANEAVLLGITHAITLFAVGFCIFLIFKVRGFNLRWLNPHYIDSRKWWYWLFLAPIIGLIMRFGSEGGALWTLWFIEQSLPLAEYNELIGSGRRLDGIAIYIFILSGIIGAFEEEFIYRRFLQRVFSARYGTAFGVLIVGLLFSLLHLSPVAFLGSLMLSAVYLVSGRLWVAVLCHFFSNMLHPFLSYINLDTDDYNIYMAASLASFLLATAWFFYATLEIKKSMSDKMPSAYSPDLSQ